MKTTRLIPRSYGPRERSWRNNVAQAGLDCLQLKNNPFSRLEPPMPEGTGWDRQKLLEVAEVWVVQGCHCDTDQQDCGEP